MVTSTLTGRMGMEPILPIKVPVTISIMLNFNGLNCVPDFGVGMCEHAFTALLTRTDKSTGR